MLNMGKRWVRITFFLLCGAVLLLSGTLAGYYLGGIQRPSPGEGMQNVNQSAQGGVQQLAEPEQTAAQGQTALPGQQEPAAEGEAAVAVDGIGLTYLLPEASVQRVFRFSGCGHEAALDCAGVAGLTQQELMALYPEDTLERFSAAGALLSCELNGYCPQHYVLRLSEGRLLITRRDDTLNDNLLMEIAPDSVSTLAGEEQQLQAGIPFDSMEAINAYFENAES